jgi:hypothetical protein
MPLRISTEGRKKRRHAVTVFLFWTARGDGFRPFCRTQPPLVTNTVQEGTKILLDHYYKLVLYGPRKKNTSLRVFGENVILVRVEAGRVKEAGEDRRVKSTVRCRVVCWGNGRRQRGLADPGFIVVVVIRVITHELTLGSCSQWLFLRGVCNCGLANLRLG